MDHGIEPGMTENRENNLKNAHLIAIASSMNTAISRLARAIRAPAWSTLRETG
jgi:hypothetical protein